MTQPRFGKVKYATIRRDFDELRSAIRKHDSFAAEAAWEKCERWMEAISPAALRALHGAQGEENEQTA
tara:strand:- start:7179 stop:7382 length:204 start_codon:yes stop_codon:yes gene_type:complete